MSDIKFTCPKCRQSLEAPYDMIGQQIDCPVCGHLLDIPSPIKANSQSTTHSSRSPLIATRSIPQDSQAVTHGDQSVRQKWIVIVIAAAIAIGLAAGLVIVAIILAGKSGSEQPTSVNAAFQNQPMETSLAQEVSPSRSEDGNIPQNGPPWLGISVEPYPDFNSRWFGLSSSTLIINEIWPGSPAEVGGLRVGDILLSIDGKATPDVEAFDAIDIGKMAIGSRLSILVLRSGKEIEVAATMAIRPKEMPPARNILPYEVRQFLGGNSILNDIYIADNIVARRTTTSEVSVWKLGASTNLAPVIRLSGAFMDITGDGSAAVVAGKFGDLTIYDVVTGRKKSDLCPEGDIELRGCRLDSRGKYVATIDEKGVFRFWDVTNAKEIYSVVLKKACESAGISSLLFSAEELGPFSPSGRFLPILSGRRLIVWNVLERRIEWSWECDNSIEAFAFSPDWSLCAVAIPSGRINILSVIDSAIIGTLRGHNSGIRGLAWHGNDYLASTGRSEWAIIWDVKKSELMWGFNVWESRGDQKWYGSLSAQFDKRTPHLWAGLFTLRELAIPALANIKSWEQKPVVSEAVDFTLAIREPIVSVQSYGYTDVGGPREIQFLDFSDGSKAFIKSGAGNTASDYSFIGSDGRTQLTGMPGMTISSVGDITGVQDGGPAFNAGLHVKMKLLAVSEKETGPFYSLPRGDDKDDEFCRIRILRGVVGSSMWLRVQDESGAVKTVRVERR